MIFLGSCRDCGRTMVAQKVWPNRPDLHEECVRANGSGMCTGCYGRARRAGTLPDPAPKPDRVRVPDVAITPSYPVACSDCGPLAAPSRRDEAQRIRDEHLNVHRAALGLPAVPGTLHERDLARLRELVGVGASADAPLPLLDGGVA